MRNRHALRLRKLADTDEIFRIQTHDALDEIVARACPGEGNGLIADVMSHRGCARRKQGEVGASRALQPKLVGLDRFLDLLVTDAHRHRGRKRRILDSYELRLAKFLVRLPRRGVVPMTVDDQHGALRRADNNASSITLISSLAATSG